MCLIHLVDDAAFSGPLMCRRPARFVFPLRFSHGNFARLSLLHFGPPLRRLIISTSQTLFALVQLPFPTPLPPLTPLPTCLPRVPYIVDPAVLQQRQRHRGRLRASGAETVYGL